MPKPRFDTPAREKSHRMLIFLILMDWIFHTSMKIGRAIHFSIFELLNCPGAMGADDFVRLFMQTSQHRQKIGIAGVPDRNRRIA